MPVETTSRNNGHRESQKQRDAPAQWVYTQVSNRRQKRSGHLFQGRFKGVLVDKDRDRDKAIMAAYATGAYNYREIAEHFCIHLATMGRIVRAHMLQCET